MSKEAKNNIIDSISNLVDKVELLFSGEPKEVKLSVDYKLSTGEIVRIDTEEVGVGTAINILAEDGTEVPLTKGTYTIIIDETNVIEVNVVGGMVESFEYKTVNSDTPAENTAPAEEAMEDAEPETEARIQALEAKVASIEEMIMAMGMNETKLAEVEAKYNEVATKYTEVSTKYTEVENKYTEAQSSIEKLSSERSQLKELFTQIFGLMKEIANTNSVEPIAKPAEKQFRKVEPMVSRIDKLQAEAIEHMNKIKENKY